MSSYTLMARKLPQPRGVGIWTAAGTWFLLLVYGVLNGGFQDYMVILERFVTFDLDGARHHADSLVRMAPVIAVAVAIKLPVAFTVGALLAKRLKRIREIEKRLEEAGKPKKNPFAAETPRNQFLGIMIILVSEELFARWLFLGVLTTIPWLSSDAAFYALFFLGNLLWALAHLNNYKGEFKEVRHPVMVLPQFIGGILLTAIYLSFGLLGAIIAHVAYDMVLFAMDRKDVFNRGEIILTMYHAIVAVVAGLIFLRSGHDIRDLKFWLDDNATSLALPGWKFGDYVTAVVLLTSSATVLAELLLYDREGGESKRDVIKGMYHFVVFALASFAAIVAMEQVWHGDVAVKVLLLSVIFTFSLKSASGSGVARAFWESMLVAPLFIGSALALGPEKGVWLVLILALLWLPDRIIRYLDKDERPKLPNIEKAVPPFAAGTPV